MRRAAPRPLAMRCSVTRRDRSRARRVSEILASRFIAIAESMSAPNIARRFSALDLTGQVAQLCARNVGTEIVRNICKQNQVVEYLGF